MIVNDAPVYATIAAEDLERAKAWYAQKLDLHPSVETMGGAMYEVGGSRFFLFPTPAAGTAQNTVMSWLVDDVAALVRELSDRGVEFETFEAPGLEWDGVVATMPTGEKGVWFKDSEGNILGAGEFEFASVSDQRGGQARA